MKAHFRITEDTAHAPWQKDEIVCLKVVEVDPAGGYQVETVETWPADLKERHAAELEDMRRFHQATLDAQAARHQIELESAQAVTQALLERATTDA